jgi:large subunit ribosomal protein L14
MLEVADNSGARKLQMILPLGGSTGLNAGLGDIITAAVKESVPEGQVQKGKVVKAVIVRTRKEHRRRDGTYIRFDSNAAVLINDAGEPVGTGNDVVEQRMRPKRQCDRADPCPRCGRSAGARVVPVAQCVVLHGRQAGVQPPAPPRPGRQGADRSTGCGDARPRPLVR